MMVLATCGLKRLGACKLCKHINSKKQYSSINAFITPHFGSFFIRLKPNMLLRYLLTRGGCILHKLSVRYELENYFVLFVHFFSFSTLEKYLQLANSYSNLAEILCTCCRASKFDY